MNHRNRGLYNILIHGSQKLHYKHGSMFLVQICCAELNKNIRTSSHAPYPVGHNGQKTISKIEISYLNSPQGAT